MYGLRGKGLTNGVGLTIIYFQRTQIQRNLELTIGLNYGTMGFKVFEVDLGGGKWKELKSLGNRALFLGNNSSISVEASDFSGCRANCIYFIGSYPDTYWSIPGGGGRDMGIHNKLDGSIEPHYYRESLSRITPPM